MGCAGGEGGLVGCVRDNKYGVYVLVVFMFVYIINQCDTFCLIATNASMAQEIGYGERECDVREENVTDLEEHLTARRDNSTPQQYCSDNTDTLCADDVSPTEAWCYWHYLGRGTQYQLLAGPMYVVLFAISGIPLGLMSELQSINRRLLLVGCVLLWSLMTALGGFATQYWHLALSRLLLGIFSAGCVPFCTSIIADYFSTAQRGTALGFFYWGVFIGYSLSFLLIIAEEELGWRAVYFIAGVPGIAMGVLIALTVREPERGASDKDTHKAAALSGLSGMVGKLRTAASHFADPVLLMLCLAGAVRNGAGLVWAYNIVLFFAEYWPDVNVEQWMSWIPLVFGSAGAFGGGYLSDKLAANRGVKGRLIILIASCLVPAPFQLAVLFLPPPWCWLSHAAGCLLGEAWLGVCATIVIELVPRDLSASAMALYYFCIKIIGGNMVLAVTPITRSLNMRLALVFTFPGLYIIGGGLFTLTLLVYVRRGGSKHNKRDSDVAVTDPLTQAPDPLTQAPVSLTQAPDPPTQAPDHHTQAPVENGKCTHTLVAESDNLLVNGKSADAESYGKSQHV